MPTYTTPIDETRISIACTINGKNMKGEASLIPASTAKVLPRIMAPATGKGRRRMMMRRRKVH